jgi:hypothetical protein
MRSAKVDYPTEAEPPPLRRSQLTVHRMGHLAIETTATASLHSFTETVALDLSHKCSSLGLEFAGTQCELGLTLVNQIMPNERSDYASPDLQRP